MLKALANVAPRHLLDTRLNPPAALRARPKLATTEDAEDSEVKPFPESKPQVLRVLRGGSLQ